MAFWGVEVKPGKPFTHEFDPLKGRLHISMATLGFGTATAKSILQCNVGNRSPVYLCSLYPGNSESLQLNLELEEFDEFIFSVIGPRSIHLCGYYLPSGRNSNINEDTESHGEDIADTETERSDYSDEDEYDDSFIDDDGDPKVFTPSSVSYEEEASNDKRPKGRKSRLRRLRRKYQSVDSDDDGCFEENNIVNGSMHDQSNEIDNEDSLPISSFCKNKAFGRVLDQEMDDIGEGVAGDASNKNGEDGSNSIIDPNLKTEIVLADSQTHREAELSDHLVHPCSVLDVGNVKKVRNKKKGKQKEAKNSCNGQSIELDNAMQDELKMDKITHVLQTGNDQYEEHADDKCQLTELVEESNIVNDSMHNQPKEIDNEDSLPISSLCKNKASEGVLDQEMDDIGDGGAGDASNKNGEDGGNSIIDPNLKPDTFLSNSQTHREAELSDHLVHPFTVLDVGNVKKVKKKKKGKQKETKSSCNGQSIELDNAMQDELKMDKITSVLQTGNDQSQEHADDKSQSIELVEESNIVNESMHNQPKEIDNEDSRPISSLWKNKASGGVLYQEKDDIGDGAAGDASNKNGEDGGKSIIDPKLKTDIVLADSQTHREAELSDHLVHPCTVLDVGNVNKVKNKKKAKQKETKNSYNGQSIELDNAMHDELKMDKITHVLQTGNDQYQEHGDDKCQSIELVEESNIVSGSITNQPKALDNEDGLPISSLYKNKSSAGVLDQEIDDIGDGGAGDASNKDGEDGGNSIIDPNLKTDTVLANSQTHREAELSDHLVHPCTVLDVGNVKEVKNKKGKQKETKSSCNGQSIKLDNTIQDELKMDKITHVLQTGNVQYQEHGDDKCQSIELVEENNIVNDSMHDQPKEIVHEDSLPISSLCKNKASAGVLDQEMDVNGNGGTGDAIYKNGEDGGNSIIDPNLKTGIVLADSQTHGEAEFLDHLVGPCTVLDVDNVQKFEKKKKGKEKEAKSSSNGPSIKLDNTMQDEPKMDKMAWDLRPANEQSHDNVDDNRGTETTDKKKILPSCEIGHGQGEKPKKKRKERSKEGIDLVANADYHSNLVNLHQRNEQNEQHIINEDVEISNNVALPSKEMDLEKRRKNRKKKEQVNKCPHIVGDNAYHKDIAKEIVQRDELESDNMIHKFPEGKEQNQKLKFQKRVDDGAHDFPDGNQSDDRKAKRKKKSKSQGNVEVLSSELPQLSVEQSSGMVREDVNKSAEAIPLQVRKLSNGLVIQELEMGKKDGKIAASGRKISIRYIGKLMENGVVFESNAGQAPFKFRLGKGEVIRGWDVGLEGMRVGEKRRLVIPPSMASKSEGHSANIPPNSWLVYDFELVKVH